MPRPQPRPSSASYTCKIEGVVQASQTQNRVTREVAELEASPVVRRSKTPPRKATPTAANCRFGTPSSDASTREFSRSRVPHEMP